MAGKEQIAIRDVELAYHQERERRLQQYLERLQAQHEQLANQGGDQILQRLSALSEVFVVYPSEAEYLSVPLQDIARYQDNPMASLSAKCCVTEEQYSRWLEHYQQPACVTPLPSGERYGMPIDRVDTPSRFAPGDRAAVRATALAEVASLRVRRCGSCR